MAPQQADRFGNSELHEVLSEAFGDALMRVGPGRWRALTPEGLQFQCMTDERANRMRFIIPVMPVGGAPKEFLTRLLEANFHSALDARYAIAQGLVWSVFLHPLRSLGYEGARQHLSQVMRLARTTGTSYSSSDLVFVGMFDSASPPVAEGRVTAQEAFDRCVDEANRNRAARPEADDTPSAFCDPITFELMEDPVQVPSGHTFERATILEHIARFNNNPLTKEPLAPDALTSNRALADAIAEWKATTEAAQA
eukprot:TRINITY_DN11341_c0_g1_i1.p1 TRINITY_DN11341_c0_g1~~TRINITY_DN11341_c0_g1_i1.p1  ORF type:complete len:253 (+),score=66.19 TRINITY_DN11341_c0_g1_i1:59-817(+)